MQFFTFWAESDPRGGGGVKTIACSYVFHVFLTLAAFSSQNQLFSGNMHFSFFSWKGPAIRTFRWKGGPCRSTPPKTSCFVSEFQCFARPEKVWKTQNFCFFMIFVDFHEKQEILKNRWKSEILLVSSISRPSDPPQKQSAAVEWSSYYKPICLFSRGAGNGETRHGPKSEILGIFMKIMMFSIFLWFSCFSRNFSFFWNFQNFHEKGSRNHENDLK